MTKGLKPCPFCGGEEDKQLRRVCEIAEDALKGGSE